MPEIQFTSVASAQRNRAALARERNENDRRVSQEKQAAAHRDDVQARKQLADKQALRTEKNIQSRRNDLEADFEVTLLRSQHISQAATIANVSDFQNRQAAITSELVQQRANRAAVYELGLSEYDESLALDQIAPGADNTSAVAEQTASYRQLLAERDGRNAERSLEQRDRSIQQQIDLQVATDNLRTSSNLGGDLPRGALVDVFG